MEKTAIQTASAPAAIGPYSQAVKIGELVFVSGQVPFDPATKELVSDPTLRAGLLVLGIDERWASILLSIIDGDNESARPVHIAFRDLPNAVPEVWESSGWQGGPVIWVNAMRAGERPELLATAIAEGALLESADSCTAQTIIAAALSSVLWSELIALDPSLVESATWGTITRNRDLLALLDQDVAGFEEGLARDQRRLRPTGAAADLELVGIALQQAEALEGDAGLLAQHPSLP